MVVMEAPGNATAPLASSSSASNTRSIPAASSLSASGRRSSRSSAPSSSGSPRSSSSSMDIPSSGQVMAPSATDSGSSARDPNSNLSSVSLSVSASASASASLSASTLSSTSERGAVAGGFLTVAPAGKAVQPGQSISTIFRALLNHGFSETLDQTAACFSRRLGHHARLARLRANHHAIIAGTSFNEQHFDRALGLVSLCSDDEESQRRQRSFASIVRRGSK